MVSTNNKIIIPVSTILSNNDYPTAGDLLYKQIMRGLDCTSIVLDMNGVSLLPSMFLNPSLGRIIKENGVGFVKNRIMFINIKSGDSKMIIEYVKRFRS